jgi:transposase InsO family protein
VLNWFQEHISEFEFHMGSVYQISGISRQAHHKARRSASRKLLLRADILDQVREARLSHPRMGSRSLHKMLCIGDIGIHQFERLLSEEGLCIPRKINRCKTTDGYRFKGKPVNLINGMELFDINQLWVSEITYFQQGDKVFYIIMIMDVYSRMILGAEVYTDMRSDIAIQPRHIQAYLFCFGAGYTSYLFIPYSVINIHFEIIYKSNSQLYMMI